MKPLEYTSKGVWVDGDHIDLADIIEEVKKKQIEEEDLVVLKFEWAGGRNWDGCVEILAVPLTQALRMKELILNKNINLGEINGKHSEIYGTMDEGDITIDKKVSNVLDFITINPSRVYYDHSFWETFAESAEYNEYELDQKTIDEITSY